MALTSLRTVHFLSLTLDFYFSSYFIPLACSIHFLTRLYVRLTTVCFVCYRFSSNRLVVLNNFTCSQLQRFITARFVLLALTFSFWFALRTANTVCFAHNHLFCFHFTATGLHLLVSFAVTHVLHISLRSTYFIRFVRCR